jgi:hypothetical protein
VSVWFKRPFHKGHKFNNTIILNISWDASDNNASENLTGNKKWEGWQEISKVTFFMTIKRMKKIRGELKKLKYTQLK